MEIRYDSPLGFAGSNIENYYKGLIHELSHGIDYEHLTLEDLEKFKGFIPLKDIVRYMKTYSEVVNDLLFSWAEMDLENALEIRSGQPLLLVDKFNDDTLTKSEWLEKAIDLAKLLGYDEKWLKSKIAEYNSVSPKKDLKFIEKNIEYYLFNIAAHKYLQLLKYAYLQNDTAHFVLTSTEYTEFLKAIVKKVAHFFVGSGLTEFNTSRFDDVLKANAEKIEWARLSMLSYNGKAPNIHQLRYGLYREFSERIKLK